MPLDHPQQGVAVTVLVTGAGGRLGRLVTGAFAARGVAVRAMGRGAPPPDCRGAWRQADLASGTGVAEAAVGVSAAVHCATESRRPRGEVQMLDTLIAAMRRGGGRIVLVGIAGIEDAAAVLPYYRAKLACEEALAASGLPRTICRATQFHPFVDQVLDRLGFGPVQLCPPMRLQPVDMRFVADRLADLATSRPAGRVSDLSGPETLTTAGLVTPWLRARDRRRMRVPIPALGPLSAWSRLRPADGETGGSGWAAWLAANRSAQVAAAAGTTP